MKSSFIHQIRFRIDNARVFQRVSTNLNITVGQAACRLLCRYTLFIRLLAAIDYKPHEMVLNLT